MAERLTDLSFNDLYLRLDAPDDAPFFRSKDRAQGLYTQIVPETFRPAVERLGVAIRAELQDRADGTLDFEGVRCRISEQKMADGSLWAYVRSINTALPDLGALGFAPHILGHLHSLGQRSGLILISGGAGHGKTTTGVGLLIDYLKTYGGTAFSLEKPVEYLTMGRHGAYGQCFQIDVQKDDDWAPMIERVMNWGARYIFLGEIRTPQAAEQLLHAATNGHTVITTVNGGMPEEALVSLLFLAEQAMGPGAREILAGCMTALLHQTIKEEGPNGHPYPFVRYLFTEENSSSDPIRALIRENKIGMLSTYIDRIAARLANQPSPGLPPMQGMPLPPIKR